MANPFFNAIGSVPMNNNMLNMINQFNQFKNSFSGDPKQVVMNMVNSGKISQNQLNQLQQAATEFRKILK